ncbi:hypothetical protein [Acidovorax sp. Leaf160]|uniref:hypothetical protein n=1 Tax=Acidovorax sp. Leaf160 TaxID=1736280 RepID=UPI0006F63BE8|nr:hypothetical protein [Acidovorax sp. Leaf160]KQR62635.1 hypothetical protein ASF94_15560 [Acidovorax sp. Leaf160]
MKKILLAVLVAGVAGAATARNPSDAEALAAFKVIVERCSALFPATDGIVSQSPDGNWRKTSRSDLQTSFDVKKTDSLVSPLEGVLRVSYLTLGATAASEAEAQALVLNPEGPAMKVLDVYHFALQDGSWVGLGVDESRELRTRPGRPFEKLSTIKKDASRVPPQSLDGQCLRVGARR